LQCVRDEQDENEVVNRELSYLALPEDAKGDQQRDVDNDPPDGQLEDIDRRHQGRRPRHEVRR